MQASDAWSSSPSSLTARTAAGLGPPKRLGVKADATRLADAPPDEGSVCRPHGEARSEAVRLEPRPQARKPAPTRNTRLGWLPA